MQNETGSGMVVRDGRKRCIAGMAPWMVQPALAVLAILLLVSCGGNSGGVIATGEQAAAGQIPGAQAGGPALTDSAAVEPAELQQALAAELLRLGIDPDKAASAAPAGEANRVFDLRARLIEPDPGDADPQASVELT